MTSFNNQKQPYNSDYGQGANEGPKSFGQKLFHAGFEDKIKILTLSYFQLDLKLRGAKCIFQR